MDIGGGQTNGGTNGVNGAWHPPASTARGDGGELLAVLPAGTSAVALGPVSSLDHALRIADFLDMFGRAEPWLWADLANQCELRWGETYAQLEAHSHLEVKTLRTRKYVGGRFPPHRRRPMLSFGHHDVAAPLPDWEQDDLLDWAEAPLREGAERPRSVAETREELWRRRGLPGGRTPGQGVPPTGRFGSDIAPHQYPGGRPAPSRVSPRNGVTESAAPGGVDLDPPWPGVETDATPRLVAWLAEGARLLDGLRDGDVFVVKRIAPRDVDASAEVLAVLSRAVGGRR